MNKQFPDLDKKSLALKIFKVALQKGLEYVLVAKSMAEQYDIKKEFDEILKEWRRTGNIPK